MTVYENIDRLLEVRNMSRRRLARLAGIKETTLAACFARRPEHFPLKYGLAIAEVLDVNVDALYGSTKHEIQTPQDAYNAINELPVHFHTVGKAPKQEATKEDQREQMLIEIFDSLNVTGQCELIKRAFEMSQLQEYKRYPDRE